VNVLTMNRKFISENNSDNGPGEHLNPAKLLRKDAMEKYHISLYRVIFIYMRERFTASGY
jgi:hypothetical protein